jgi:CubicO group peptidase (beta-lactamase class C family)
VGFAAPFFLGQTVASGLGAACAIYHRGEKVVDLWGGYRDLERHAPWQEDTLVLVYSTTKGLAGMTVAVAHSRGLIDYDEKFATYWPEFAQGGKESITVRQLLSHPAGLSGLDKPLDCPTIATPDALASAGMKANSSAASTLSIGAWVDSSRKRLRSRSAWSSTSVFRRRCPIRGSRPSRPSGRCGCCCT